MSSDLRKKLSEKYKLVFFGDLADVCDQHGSAFRLFKLLHKEHLEADERIVFYSSQRPSLKLLNHLQRAASKIDISNFFIVICGPYDITDDLQQANKNYGYDNTSISWYYFDIKPSQELIDKNIYISDSWCPAPFNSLNDTFELDSKVAPCCKYQGTLGDLTNQTLSDIMKGDKAVALRDQFKQGIKPTECNVCWQIESVGSTSLRQHLLNKDEELLDLKYIDTPGVQIFSTDLGSVCNFKCRICNSFSSTAIAAEEMRYTTNKADKKALLTRIQNTGVVDFDKFLNTINPVLANLEMLHMLGGEPLLAKNFIPLLDFIIESNHSYHIKVHINTNASVWNDNLIDRLVKFQGVEMLLSIDDIEKRFELQRGGDWAVVAQNIQKWANLRSENFIVKISPTVNIQNVFYLDHLLNYCQKFNFELVWNYLENPKSCCIDNMTDTAKQLIYNKYVNHPEKELKQIAHRMKKTKAVSGAAFLNLMKELDVKRATNFPEAHSEIINAMENR